MLVCGVSGGTTVASSRLAGPKEIAVSSVNRRAFLKKLGWGMIAVPVASKLVGCAADDGGDYPPNPGPTGPIPGPGNTQGGPDAGQTLVASFAVQNTDGSGHLHSFDFTCEVALGSTVTFVAGGAHTHQVTLTASEVDQVLAGGSVTVQTSDGHPHTWVVEMPADGCGAYDGSGGGGTNNGGGNGGGGYGGGGYGGY